MRGLSRPAWFVALLRDEVFFFWLKTCDNTKPRTSRCHLTFVIVSGRFSLGQGEIWIQGKKPLSVPFFKINHCDSTLQPLFYCINFMCSLSLRLIFWIWASLMTKSLLRAVNGKLWGERGGLLMGILRWFLSQCKPITVLYLDKYWPGSDLWVFLLLHEFYCFALSEKLDI